MNKALKFGLFSVIVATAGVLAFQYVGTKKASASNTPAATASSTTGTTEKPTEEKASEVAPVESSSETESLNNQKPGKAGKVAVLFRDGTSVSEAEINKELDDIPDQLSARMSLAEIKQFLAWRLAYKKVMTEAAIKSGVMKSDTVRELVEKRKATAAGFMLLDEKSKELMTFSALKKHYDNVWDKNFKGTKEFSLTAITTSDKATADNIKNTVKNATSLKKILETTGANTKHMEMDSRPQASLPPEISNAVLKEGANSVVGPFEIRGSYMVFYVKSIKDAQKREFTAEFAEEYKKAAVGDFSKDYTKGLYKKYAVKVFDVNGKEADPFEIATKGSDEKSQQNLVKLSKLKDDAVLASYNGGKVTVKDVKEFFKVKSLLDETFVSMAQQFNIPTDKVVIYAVKLVVDDDILAKEVKAIKYDETPKVMERLTEIGNMELQHAYFKENVKVKPEDVKLTFDKFIKSIPEEDKNDNEISTKVVFFATQEDASQALKRIRSGEDKFNSVFKEKSGKKEAFDLGYVQKRGTSPELWQMLKTGASGTCCQEVVNLNGADFGANNMNYALVYVADRRPVTLPSLSNESEKQYFQRLAERNKAVELAKSHMIAGVKNINGKSVEELEKANPEYVERMLSVLLGYAG
ncbi:MAG: peptidyl-prolyl cis-trans isomerase [Alphaproteobacteria bacterium]|nr:peptidyl-prolyl cis-trans isomerase [Alphaproteobacteria bacterium]